MLLRLLLKRIAELEAALIEAEADWEQERRNFRELEGEQERIKCEIGLWLDGDQTPLKSLMNLVEILRMK
jgi:hypothetical protein